ncbi:DUF1549 domain-containing protein [Rhodopirellula sp. P2]|uniref:DUF1549 domain-containing protein n=1 Tax=Rhodopirellula sp. P2 TaxID=2127060 RepID=UPI0023676B2E|nr:DUF1549 domain-containing protein [Rhodopirellula sp. P2]WDQ18492.1 DUF1549 domain-containing protein [Rhodopirellula sp. P2]
MKSPFAFASSQHMMVVSNRDPRAWCPIQWCGLAVLTGCFAVFASADEATEESFDFFEARIRPVLIEHCYECHAAESEELGGSLRLDVKAGWEVGGDSGPAIRPGDPAASELMAAIRYESSEMPPAGKLPDNIVRDFEKWIRGGAADPRLMDDGEEWASSQTKSFDWEQAREFWAFQPPQSSVSPAAFDSGSAIDAFVQERMTAEGLTATPIATPSVRLRRLAFDLTGLPPDPETLRRFQADPSDAHWERLVNRYLSSPQFAEHWARHWMDVARYADSNGSDFNATHHDAWRYRDYLVRSFADDVPIDRMIREQIAGDLMPATSEEDRHDKLVATTFLMIGTKMLSERNKTKLRMDVVDEQLDTVGRAFLGMTFGCARCHDHKFDPITTRDYYAMAGIFRSTRTLHGESQEYVSTWKKTPLPSSKEHKEEIREHERLLQRLDQELQGVESELKLLAEKTELEGITVDDVDAVREGHWVESTYTPGFIGKGYVHDENRNKGEASIRFPAVLPEAGRYELRVHYNSSGNRASNLPVTVQLNAKTHALVMNQTVRPTRGTSSVLGKFDCEAETHATVTFSNRGTDGYVIADAVQWVHVDEDNAAGDSAELAEQTLAMRTALTQKLQRLKSERADVVANAPPPVPTAMALADLPSDEQGDCPVHVRGEVSNLGDIVPRGIPQVFSESTTAFEPLEGSGRLELAQWLTDPDHPLTARVSVNRIWMHLMGEGLVRTVDNFGVRGEKPTHPELLDALTVDFVRNGWRQKRLIRNIVCSDAYSRSMVSDDDPRVALDPENRFRSRAVRRRIPAEAIRDAMLVAAGTLDRSGREDLMDSYATLVSQNNAHSKVTTKFGLDDPKRTLYLPLIRSEVPPLLANLDAADPDLLVGKRPTTNVPAQALTLIGSPEVRQWAMLTTKRMLGETSTDSQRVRWACEVLFSRDPRPVDEQVLQAWLASQAAREMSSEDERYREWIAAMLASTEFRFLD